MDRFVVGTGRCGSTLLSRMLGENHAVLSVFEFFTGLDMSRRFIDDDVPGSEIADLVSGEQPMVTAVLRRGYRVEEITYPFEENEEDGAKSGIERRYGPNDPLPWILVSTLGRLSEDPDTLYDEVMVKLRSQTPKPPREHYREIFEWLSEKYDCDAWIERSGSSIDYLVPLSEQFPDAKFLHLHRDGCEVALSMREHHAYRLPISLIYNAELKSGKRVSELGPIDVHAPPSGDDPISQILESRPPPAAFGRYWTDQVLHGYRALANLDTDQYLEIRFEDVCNEPRKSMQIIADFFELPSREDDWMDRAAAIVRGLPPARFDQLAQKEQDALRAECRAGGVLLGREF
jgi:hypothetical protein